LSSEHETLVAFVVENANAADVAVVGLAGLELMVTEGGGLVVPLPAVVFVHVANAWLEPAVLATRTLKVCEPSESPVSVKGDVQVNAAVLSREHVVVVAPEDVQLMVTDVADVLAGGCAVSVTVGATVTSGAAEAKPATTPARSRSATVEEMRRREDMGINSER
jgi:hypothetical protein